MGPSFSIFDIPSKAKVYLESLNRKKIGNYVSRKGAKGAKVRKVNKGFSFACLASWRDKLS
jgi:hypothetical protein